MTAARPIESFADTLLVGMIQTTLDFQSAWKDGPKMSALEEERAIQEISHFMSALRQEKPAPQIILMPELAVPRGYTRTLQGIAKAMEAIVIAGLDYRRLPGKKVANEAVVLVPDKWRDSRVSTRVMSYVVGKTYPADGERHLLQQAKYEFHPSPQVWIFDAGDLGTFAVAICYDFLDLERLALYRLQVQHLFILAYNMDTPTFDHAAEAMARMVFCNVVICNCGHYGGSVVVSPYRKPERRTIYRHSGASLGSAQIVTLPVKSLIQHQISPRPRVPGTELEFKALPPGSGAVESIFKKKIKV